MKTKKELKGIFPFKEAFTTYFISAVIGILISMVFNIILFNFIDPAAKDTIKELTIKYAVEMMQKFNAPAASINQAIKDMQANDQFAPDVYKRQIQLCVFNNCRSNGRTFLCVY